MITAKICGLAAAVALVLSAVNFLAGGGSVQSLLLGFVFAVLAVVAGLIFAIVRLRLAPEPHVDDSRDVQAPGSPQDFFLSAYVFEIQFRQTLAAGVKSQPSSEDFELCLSRKS